MSNEVSIVLVTERALRGRINRKLKRESKQLCVARSGSRLEANVGRFYVLDMSRNTIVDSRIDIEVFGRDLGVMQEPERVWTLDDQKAQDWMREELHDLTVRGGDRKAMLLELGWLADEAEEFLALFDKGRSFNTAAPKPGNVITFPSHASASIH